MKGSRAWRPRTEVLLLLAGGAACSPAPRQAAIGRNSGASEVALASVYRHPADGRTPRASGASSARANRDTPPRVAPLEALRSLDLAARLGDYPARDAAWAEKQPVVVGRDFDFSLAGTLPGGIGVGLAAAKRQRVNRELADLISAQATISPEALLDMLTHRCVDARAVLDGTYVAIYGVLYGAEEARLRVVVELTDGHGHEAHYAVVSAAGPAQALAKASRLHTAFRDGLTAVAQMLNEAQRHPPPPGAEVDTGEGSCATGGSTKLSGRVVGRADEQIELKLEALSAPLWVRCAVSDFTAAVEPSPIPIEQRDQPSGKQRGPGR